MKKLLDHGHLTLKNKTRNTLTFYLLVSPFLITFVTLSVFPLAYGAYLSFTNFTGFNIEKLKFVGLRNYIRVFTDNDAMYSLLRTLEIGAITVPISLIVSFFLALLLVQNIRCQGIFRTIYYLPSIIPAVAGALMWKLLLGKDRGIINLILGLFGIEPIWWLGYDFCTTSLIMTMAWGAAGGILVNMAGLKNIPVELYEAATIDGASGWRKMKNITLPLFSPILFYNLLMGIINTLPLCAQPVLLSNGTGLLSVPLRPNYTYLVHIYQQVYGAQRFGYGLALSWVVAIIIIFITMIALKTSGSWVFYEVGQDGG
ncbi:MAG: sugar ABC transporter permease [Angelakisella sp.]